MFKIYMLILNRPKTNQPTARLTYDDFAFRWHPCAHDYASELVMLIVSMVLQVIFIQNKPILV